MIRVGVRAFLKVSIELHPWFSVGASTVTETLVPPVPAEVEPAAEGTAPDADAMAELTKFHQSAVCTALFFSCVKSQMSNSQISNSIAVWKIEPVYNKLCSTRQLHENHRLVPI